MVVLELERLEVRIGGKLICRDLDLQLTEGEVLGILGRNGVGKTTLLHSCMDFFPPASGNVRIHGANLQSLKRQQLARKIGLLFQESDSSLSATVLETVLLGRHPYSENIFWDSEEDIELCRITLALLGMDKLENRQVSTLSGGEKQRLAIALLLAQDPAVFLLDEPSNHLDIDFQIKVLDLITQRAKQNKAATVMASHDINLVSRFCDRVLLLLGDGEFLSGSTSSILNSNNLNRAFQCKIAQTQISGRNYYLPE